MEFLPVALIALNSYRQFINFVLVPSKTRPGKSDKFPVNHENGAIFNAHDPSIWTDADTAIAAAKRLGAGYGVGFVFTEADPFWFLDIDGCLEENNTWSPLALTLLSAFPGAAIEISSSRRGLHVIGSGAVPPHGCRNDDLKLEFYHTGRFVALTGTNAAGDASRDFTPQVKWLVDNYFSNKTATVSAALASWTDGPCEGWNGPSDDLDLLRRALQSKSAKSVFGVAASFADLFDADEAVLAKVYPANDTDIYNRSSADAGLAQHLAFWTGNDCERIRRLMSQSKLKREKWDREDYLPRTILGVCGRQTEWLNDKPSELIVPKQAIDVNLPVPIIRAGNPFLSIEEQVKRFTGCVYVSDEHKVFVPDGRLLNPERFKSTFSGFNMVMDTQNAKTTTDSWKAFVESQAFTRPEVNSTCFRPDQPSGGILVSNGMSFVNTYVPINTKRIKGDPKLFLEHLIRLFPDERDREIIMSFMAAIVQYPGVKFRWCPLIQGVPGNGKTLLSLCVRFAVGYQYCHTPKAAELASRFNDWLYAKIFISVEDAYVPESKSEFMEAIKPMISNDTQEIEPKGGMKVTKDICCNFILNTNNKDAIRKTNDDRRFAPLFTAQQCKEDKFRDGLTGRYFNTLFNWFKGDGFAIVNELLHTYPIADEFNPAVLCLEAPETSSTGEAINESSSPAQQEIAEAIEEGRVGFKGKCISSIKLTQLLEQTKMSRAIPPRKRRELLRQLGYIPHPALANGRASKIIGTEGGKPIIYVREDSELLNLTNPSQITDAYTDAQTKVVDDR